MFSRLLNLNNFNGQFLQKVTFDQIEASTLIVISFINKMKER